MLINVPLAKASYMTKPLTQGKQTTREVTTDNHWYNHLLHIFMIAVHKHETHRDTCTYGNMTECYQWLFSNILFCIFSKFPLMSIYFIVISKKYMLILKEWQWVWRY